MSGDDDRGAEIRQFAAERDTAVAAALVAIERLEHLSQRASVFVMHIISGEPFGADVLQPWIVEITAAAIDAARLRTQVSDRASTRWWRTDVGAADIAVADVLPRLSEADRNIDGENVRGSE